MDFLKSKATGKEPITITAAEQLAYQPFTTTFSATEVAVPNKICVIVRRTGKRHH
jgi:hypothetical protein